MNGLKVIYLATADARGHLMRAQLITHALRANGATVDVLTTSEQGRRFLAEFDIEATMLSPHYAVQFDTRQNMLRKATDANVAAYLFHPGRMLRDVWRLRAIMREATLVINDSFHPALLFMGCMPRWRHKVVHVYGTSLRHALETNFKHRVPGWLATLFGRVVALQIDRSRARLEHDFAFGRAVHGEGNSYRLPTPVAIAHPPPKRRSTDAATENIKASARAPRAAVYLNPHFQDIDLARALENGLSGAGVSAHLVGEGYAERSGWLAQDANWIDHAVRSDLIISAPGMAALSVACVYRRPILLVVTEQPEQQMNAARAKELGVLHRTVVWRGDARAFANAVHTASRELLAASARDGADSTPSNNAAPQSGIATARGESGHAAAMARLQSWVSVLSALAQRPR
ncbi:hypothetical protein HSX11_11370 [Oxalobacteraceae bacterium]|nr:hypothetical protein [Oxalobacteraceae bacterium]